jgi:asparagine synthetase B (glutamine-hydrolysing)
MCGIIITNNNISNLDYINQYCKNRGPDYTNFTTINNIHFVHNLLHITGDYTIQPFNYDNNYVAIFNGEIYNYKELYPQAKSDGDCIIPTYLKYGSECMKQFDGDFCIVIFDFIQRKILISSDTFKTKPLFYNISNGNIIISSYETCCKRINSTVSYNSMQANECLSFSLDTYSLIEKYEIVAFQLNQYKNTYDDWITAFEKAVLKRYPENITPVICLSSGMDSGAISCCLKKYNRLFYPITIPKNENETVLMSRRAKHENLMFLDLSDHYKSFYKDFLTKNCEPCSWYWYNQRAKGSLWTVNAFDMGSMLGTSLIVDTIRKQDNNCKVMLSGIGSDEVMATHNFYDYVNWGQMDYFPNDLHDIFPWFNFFKGSQENYIRGQEYIGGCFSFETRYPFLDKEVVQEFLWLTPELKNGSQNMNIKPTLIHYLTLNDYPFCIEKKGFNV